ncbi:MAG: hypothetical protein IPH44_18720 [Myxococcales bacterium]|nr:hypothetical protein [Myxococcales bacterium]MBK7197281.1 hypothetical protein [Myxococcales bacterium]
MATILLVANAGDHAELAAALRGDGDAPFDHELVFEVGDDATLARFIELAPAVVVVSAALDDGDARALISAMRDAMLPRKVFVVLIGDLDGPIRTAIDALGVGERFVARPLSAKALRYAVTSGLAAAGAAPIVAPAIVEPAVAPVADAPTAPVAPPPDLRARWAALADELGGDEDDTHDDDDEAAARGPELPALAAPDLPAAPAWRPGSTEVPPAPREPTLILSERAVEADVGGLGGGDDRAWSQPTPTGTAPRAWSSSTPAPIGDDLDDDPLDDDVAAGIDDDLSVDLERKAPPPPSPEPPPAGGDFARELRRKMSLMAERLFKSGDLPAAPVAIGPAHDHHTEIDLGGLVDDDHDLTAATFVGADERATDPHAGRADTATSKGEGGELARGTADAPALIARMFVTDFTGRVVFHADRAEKVIHFEGGRPVFASSNLARDRMGELLVREGKITREQHDRCQDQVRDTGRRMGEILVDRGYLKRRELLPAVRRHVEDIIYSLFAWDRGDYRLIVGDGATGERIRLSRHPAAMVLEGVRRKLDRATLERLVGPPTTHVEITDRDKLAAIVGAADLSNEERAALTGLDGASDLTAVSRAAGLGLAGLYPLVWSLTLLGLASARRRAGDDDGDAPALIGESDLAIDRARVRARAALVADADYFALLGVRPDATGFEIKRAYEAARRDFAADGFPGELRRELERELDEIAVVLDEAYRVLRDDALRAAYRAHLREPDEAA